MYKVLLQSRSVNLRTYDSIKSDCQITTKSFLSIKTKHLMLRKCVARPTCLTLWQCQLSNQLLMFQHSEKLQQSRYPASRTNLPKQSKTTNRSVNCFLGTPKKFSSSPCSLPQLILCSNNRSSSRSLSATSTKRASFSTTVAWYFRSMTIIVNLQLVIRWRRTFRLLHKPLHQPNVELKAIVAVQCRTQSTWVRVWLSRTNKKAQLSRTKSQRFKKFLMRM